MTVEGETEGALEPWEEGKHGGPAVDGVAGMPCAAPAPPAATQTSGRSGATSGSRAGITASREGPSDRAQPQRGVA